MASVGQRNTAPEWIVRRLLHARGFRYRLHAKDLPGKPDIVFRSLKKVVFVHGCFWHGHVCSKGRAPKSRGEYWLPKLEANRRRDEHVQEQLKLAGWDMLVVWQCETRELETLAEKLWVFLENDRKSDRQP